MISKLNVIIFIYALSILSTALGREQVVTQATIRGQNKLISLSLGLNDSTMDIDSMKVIEQAGHETLSVLEFSDAEAPEYILMEEGNYQVLKLVKKDGFNLYTGGPIELDYLRNGAVGSRRTVNLELVREGDSWKLITSEGEDASNLEFVINRVFGRELGINRINVQ